MKTSFRKAMKYLKKNVPGFSFLTHKGYLSGGFWHRGFLSRGFLPGVYVVISLEQIRASSLEILTYGFPVALMFYPQLLPCDLYNKTSFADLARNNGGK